MMIGFCGAIDFEGRAASFSELKRMCGLHSGGCAYVNSELALLCDIPIDRGNHTLDVCEFGDSYCAAVIDASGVPLGESFDGKRLATGYIKEGIEYIGRLSFPFSLAVYDAHHGELFLARAEQESKSMFYSEKDGVLYFCPALRPLIRLWGGCVRVRYEGLKRVILADDERGAKDLFFDISELEPSQMLIRTCFDKTVLHYRTEKSACIQPQTARLKSIKDMRHSLCELLFSRDYPNFDITMLDGMKKHTLRAIERQVDHILEEYEGCYMLTDILPHISEKSIPLRVKQKGMLAESLMWLDTFNIVLK